VTDDSNGLRVLHDPRSTHALENRRLLRVPLELPSSMLIVVLHQSRHTDNLRLFPGILLHCWVSLDILRAILKAYATMSTGLHMCSSTSNVSQPGHDIFSTPENDKFYAAYKYEQLDPSKQEIRLLRILPGRGDGTVKCELLTKAPLDSVTKTYSALSYCAGDPKRTQCIIVNGRKFRAFANLAHALAEARFFWKNTYETRELLLWVDQICISQHNLLERS
jgi:hypothetical protein